MICPSRSPLAGPLFENHLACEIVKAQQHHGHRRELYFLRDKTGVEVDFAVPLGARRLALVEAKTTRTILPKMGHPMRLFMGAAKGVRTCSADSLATKILGLPG